jgi:phage terminase large subunit
VSTATATRRVYRPRGASAAAFECRDGEILVDGPAGTGKSRGLLEKLHMMMLANPGAKGLITRKTAVSLTNTALATFEKHVVAEALSLGIVRWFGGSGNRPAAYLYDNGSSVNVGGMDKPTKIMSSEYDVIYVQEATELNVTDWESLTTRLRNGVISFQQLLADCNPDRPTHFLKLRADTGRVTLLHSRHEDNPRLFHDDGTMTAEGKAYIERLDALTGVRYLRLRKGLWVAAEGIIWPEFDPAKHLVDRPKEPPDEWRRIWTVDFGFTHPFVCQMWAIDPDGRAFRYREFFGTKTLVEDWAKQILASVTRADGSWKEPKPEKILCDHDAEDRATLEKHLGLPTSAAKKTVSDGVQAVAVRFKTDRLFLVRDALVRRDPLLQEAGRPCCTEEEVGGYVWNETKDQPVKEMDDGCDTMRYLVADLDLQREVRMRWLS